MESTIDLKSLEKKTWLSTFEDGFFDIMMGAVLVFISVMPVVRAMIGYWYIPIILIVPGLFSGSLMYFGKRLITVPRMGFAEFGAERKTRQKRSLIISILSSIVLVILVILTALGKFSSVFGVTLSGFMVPLGIALAVVAVLSLKAWLLGIPHLELYGAAIGAGILSVEFLRPGLGDPWHYMVSFGAPGLCILVYGLYRFRAFLGKYPIPDGEV